MHAITNRVRSRSPSSRFSPGAGSAIYFGLQFDPDAAQSLGEKLRPPAQPDTDVAFEAEVSAGHDQDALLLPDPLAQPIAGRCGVVFHEAQSAGPRLAVHEKISEARDPL